MKKRPAKKRAIPRGPDTDIDAKWIDVACASDGLRPSPEDELFGERFPPALAIPKREWNAKISELRDRDFADGDHPKGCIVANYTPHVFDQTPESSCVYNATAGAFMRRFAIANGIENGVVLSPMSGYCRVATSRHSGAYVWRAMELLRDEGLLPSATYRNQRDVFTHTFHENTPFSSARYLPAGWQVTAKQFRVVEWCAIRSVEEYGSALLNQMPVVMGRSGHSMVAEDLVVKSGNYYARICDSYGSHSRDGTGRVFDSERTMAASVGGAWACRVVTRPRDIFGLKIA